MRVSCAIMLYLALCTVFSLVGCGRSVVSPEGGVSVSPSADYPSVPDSSPPASECSSDSGCVRGGCSGTVCSPNSAGPVFTTCEWKDEYACYRTAECGCVGGKCAWKQTPGLDDCISKARASEQEGAV